MIASGGEMLSIVQVAVRVWAGGGWRSVLPSRKTFEIVVPPRWRLPSSGYGDVWVCDLLSADLN
jgi:hypothetical protein